MRECRARNAFAQIVVLSFEASKGPRLCENYPGGGKATKMAEFMASLVELSHKYIAFRKRAATKRDEL